MNKILEKIFARDKDLLLFIFVQINIFGAILCLEMIIALVVLIYLKILLRYKIEKIFFIFFISPLNIIRESFKKVKNDLIKCYYIFL